MNRIVAIFVAVEECEETDSGSERRGKNPCPQILNPREGRRLRLSISGVNYTLIIILVYPSTISGTTPRFYLSAAENRN